MLARDSPMSRQDRQEFNLKMFPRGRLEVDLKMLRKISISGRATEAVYCKDEEDVLGYGEVQGFCAPVGGKPFLFKNIAAIEPAENLVHYVLLVPGARGRGMFVRDEGPSQHDNENVFKFPGSRFHIYATICVRRNNEDRRGWQSCVH